MQCARCIHIIAFIAIAQVAVLHRSVTTWQTLLASPSPARLPLPGRQRHRLRLPKSQSIHHRYTCAAAVPPRFTLLRAAHFTPWTDCLQTGEVRIKIVATALCHTVSRQCGSQACIWNAPLPCMCFTQHERPHAALVALFSGSSARQAVFLQALGNVYPVH